MVLFLKNVEKYGKTAVFPGGYGQIGEITHGRLGSTGLTLFMHIKNHYHTSPPGVDLSYNQDSSATASVGLYLRSQEGGGGDLSRWEEGGRFKSILV